MRFFIAKAVGGKGVAMFNAWDCFIVTLSVLPPLPPTTFSAPKTPILDVSGWLCAYPCACVCVYVCLFVGMCVCARLREEGGDG